MQKESVKRTQELWKNEPNVKAWIEAISPPAKHIMAEGHVFAVDAEYQKAVESLSYILLGEEAKVSLEE